MNTSNQQYDIILFDGFCNLCNGAVQFVIRHDKKMNYKFASLQSEFSASFLQSLHINIKYLPRSIVLIRNNKIYTQSSAALRITQKLNGIWPILSGLLIIPKFIRDQFYKWISDNRYKWFGKRDSCMMPNPELEERFLG